MNEYSTLPVPEGRFTGCLPRSTRLGEVCPLFGERIKALPDEELDSFFLSMRPFVREILDQDGAGSCATESTTGAVMLCRALGGQEHVSLNPWFIYYHTRIGDNGGSSIDANLAFARDRGIAPVSVWPRNKGWRTRPSEDAYEAAQSHRIEEFFDIGTVNEARTAIVLGYPVVYGAKGHSVLKIDTTGMDLNSWGESWGDSGFGVWAGFRSINWAYGAFAVRVASFVERTPQEFEHLCRRSFS